MKAKILYLLLTIAACVAADTKRPNPNAAGVVGIERPVRKPAPPSWEAYSLQGRSFAVAQQDIAGSTGDIADVRLPGPYSGQFLSMLTTTNWPGCTGNMTRKSVAMWLRLDAYNVEPPVIFASQWEAADWNTCPAPPSARLFFTSVRGKYDVDNANAHPTQYWWCCTDFGSWDLTAVDNRGAYVEASISDPHQWTDALGRSALLNLAAFNQCVSNIAQIGLSGGGNCFYDTGVALGGTPNYDQVGEAVLRITAVDTY